MNFFLVASALSSAHASVAVPQGKAVIETKEYDGIVQCGGNRVKSKFQVDQDKCYSLAAVPTSAIYTDQTVHCREDDYFEITTYKSTDGSCSGTPEKGLWQKGSCIIPRDGGFAGVFVQCPKVLNIVELAESVKDLSSLVSAVVAADLADTLSGKGPFTVFAPTNEGFAALPKGTLDNLMKPENKAELADILTYHVLPQKVLSTQLKASQTVKTVEGKDLAITKDSQGVIVGNRKVSAADNLATNGVVHIIDGVLSVPKLSVPQLPNIVELAESVKDLSTLVSAVVAADLADTLSGTGPFTVFAPTNEGFAALPKSTLDDLMKPENKAQLADILAYHVLPVKALAKDLDLFQAVKTVEGKLLHVQKWGGAVKVGPSLESKDLKSVTTADNVASNGVVHIIDGVMIPPTRVSAVLV